VQETSYSVLTAGDTRRVPLVVAEDSLQVPTPTPQPRKMPRTHPSTASGRCRSACADLGVVRRDHDRRKRGIGRVVAEQQLRALAR
jgi:hypothetical protein